MPNEFRKEVERTYLLPSTYSVPNTPHVHIRQSHLFDATSITELIEGVAKAGLMIQGCPNFETAKGGRALVDL
jgi:hypothetical protein